MDDLPNEVIHRGQEEKKEIEENNENDQIDQSEQKEIKEKKEKESHSDSNEANESEEPEKKEKEKKENLPKPFECMICMDTAHDAVVTQCGHIFCWECLCQWLERQQTCPICKSRVTEDSVIPVYNSETTTDPRTRTRPQGHYTPQPQRPQNGFFPFGMNSPMQIHVAGFPFGGFGFSMGFGQDQQQPQRELTEEEIRQRKTQQIIILIFILLPVILRIAVMFM